MAFNWGAFAGQAVSGIGSPSLQHHASQQNKEQSWEMFSANERLMNNAHQREVEDLKKAGINPILTATGGSGAGSSSGSPATMASPSIDMPDLMAYGVSLKQLEQKDRELGQKDKQVGNETDLTKSSIAKNLTEAELKKLEALQTKQGLVGKTLGTEATQNIKKNLGEVGKAGDQLLRRGVQEAIKRIKIPQTLLQSEPPSSGGNLPNQ